MSKTNVKVVARKRRHRSIRKTVHGTADRPRIAIYRSANHIYAQVINDDSGATLASASSLCEEVKANHSSGNRDAAEAVGKLIAERAQAADVTTVVFDRGGYLYHGRVAALAAGARAGGLEF